MFDRLDYFLYMAEGAGMDDMVQTRETKINAIINNFVRMARNHTDINDSEIQEFVIHEKHGINFLTEKEKNYIAREVEKRI